MRRCFTERSLDDPALQRGARCGRSGAEGSRALSGDRGRPALDAGRAPTPRSRRCSPASTPALLQPPVNVLRLSLHPDGLAPRIANLAEWRAHLLARLRQQIDVSADAELIELLDELAGYPAPGGARRRAPRERRIRRRGRAAAASVTDAGVLSFFCTTTIFGTPVDVTLSELAIESFFPADAATAERLRAAHDRGALRSAAIHRGVVSRTGRRPDHAHRNRLLRLEVAAFAELVLQPRPAKLRTRAGDPVFDLVDACNLGLRGDQRRNML